MLNILKKSAKKVGVYVLLSIFLLFTIFPFLYMISTSLSEEENIYIRPPKWISLPFKISNYQLAWESINFPRLYLNSLLVASIATIVSLFFSSLAAFVFARKQFPGRDILFWSVASTLMIPFQVIIVPLFLMVKYLGLVDTYLGLILPYLADAFGIFLIRQYLMNIPLEIDEAAKIDGCSDFLIYLKIILPISKPILVTTGIFKFMWVYNNLIWPLAVVKSENLRTIPLGMAMLLGQFSGQRVYVSILMAASAISMIVPLVVYIFGQNFFIKGLTAGAVKE